MWLGLSMVGPLPWTHAAKVIIDESHGEQFYGTENKIWTCFRLVGSTEKNGQLWATFWVDWFMFWLFFFSKDYCSVCKLCNISYIKKIWIVFWLKIGCIVGFYLHLLVFPFVCRFSSKIVAQVYLSFTNDKFRRISTSFEHHFKIYLLWFSHKK